jgi:hypothetical protein
MSATVEEQRGLQAAIARALEKEDRERGVVAQTEAPIRYIAKMVVGSKMNKIETTDVKVFINAVRKLRTQYPKLPIYCFQIEETKLTICDSQGGAYGNA